jgi:hypothetical protein
MTQAPARDRVLRKVRFRMPAFGTPGTPVIPATLRALAPGRRLPSELAVAAGAVEHSFSGARFGPAAQGSSVRLVPAASWQSLADTLYEMRMAPAFSTEAPGVVAVALEELTGPALSGNDGQYIIPLTVRARHALGAAFGAVDHDHDALARLTVADLTDLRNVGPATALEVMTLIGDGVVQWLESRHDREQTWKLPVDLSTHASAITGDDPRFREYLQPGQSLADAARDQSLTPEDAYEFFACLTRIIGLPVQGAVADLLVTACAGDPNADARDGRSGISLENGWRQAFYARYGLDGLPPVTLDQASTLVPSAQSPTGHITRERVRQQTDKLTARLPRPAWVPSLTFALQVVVDASPVLAERVGQVLAPLGLSHPQMHGAALLAMAELVGIDVQTTTGTSLALEDGWLLDVRDRAAMTATALAARHTAKFGLTTVQEICQELSSSDSQAEAAKVERVLRASADVRWTSDAWLWESSRDPASLSTNTLRNQTRSMLSVNSPLPAASVYDGFRRTQRFRGRDIVPSLDAVTEFLSDHPEFTVSGGLVALVEPLDYHDVLGPVAGQMVDVFKASPFGVMDRATMHEECTAAGIAVGTFTIWTTYAEWMANFGRNVWGLRGTQVPPSVVDEIQAAARARGRAEARHRSWSWGPDGRLVLVADVNTSLWTSGVITLPPPVRQILGARRFAAAHAHGAGGTLAFSSDHDWTWGWGPALRELQARVGDVVRATLDLTDGTAWVEVGDRRLFSSP